MTDPFVAAAYILGLGTLVAYVMSLRHRKAEAAQRQGLVGHQAARDRLDREAQ